MTRTMKQALRELADGKQPICGRLTRQRLVRSGFAVLTPNNAAKIGNHRRWTGGD